MFLNLVLLYSFTHLLYSLIGRWDITKTEFYLQQFGNIILKNINEIKVSNCAITLLMFRDLYQVFFLQNIGFFAVLHLFIIYYNVFLFGSHSIYILFLKSELKFELQKANYF